MKQGIGSSKSSAQICITRNENSGVTFVFDQQLKQLDSNGDICLFLFVFDNIRFAIRTEDVLFLKPI